MNERILLADDAPFMRMIQKDILEKNGFEICGEATHGMEVIEKYEELLPDVLILGLVLPKMDGIDVLREIKSNYPEAKVIVCSSMAREHYIVNALKHGASHFIIKPFDGEAFVSAVKSVIANTKMAAMLGVNKINDWCSRQNSYKPDENLTQEQADQIIGSYYQLFSK